MLVSNSLMHLGCSADVSFQKGLVDPKNNPVEESIVETLGHGVSGADCLKDLVASHHSLILHYGPSDGQCLQKVLFPYL